MVHILGLFRWVKQDHNKEAVWLRWEKGRESGALTNYRSSVYSTQIAPATESAEAEETNYPSEPRRHGRDWGQEGGASSKMHLVWKTEESINVRVDQIDAGMPFNEDLSCMIRNTGTRNGPSMRL